MDGFSRFITHLFEMQIIPYLNVTITFTLIPHLLGTTLILLPLL